MMEVHIGDVVMPGDLVKEVFPSKGKIKVILGPGLRREGDNIFICKAGILKKRDPFIYYVNSYEKRYLISIKLYKFYKFSTSRIIFDKEKKCFRNRKTIFND